MRDDNRAGEIGQAGAGVAGAAAAPPWRAPGDGDGAGAPPVVSASWPAALRGVHATMLALREPALLVVGPDARCFANDAMTALLPGRALEPGTPLPGAGATGARLASWLTPATAIDAVARVPVVGDDATPLGELLLPRLVTDAGADYRHAAELSPEVPWIASPDGRIVQLNQRWADITGMSPEEGAGDGWKRAMHPDDLPDAEAAWGRSVATGEPLDVEHRVGRGDGDGVWRWMRARARAQRDAAGRIVRWYGITEDVDERRRAQSLVDGQKEALELAAHGAPTAEVLRRLARAASDLFAGSAGAGVLLTEPAGRELRLAAWWQLPPGYVAATSTVPIGPDATSCGRAAYSGQAVFVTDLSSVPPAAEAWRAVALAHGIRACWSKPITTLGGEVVGTLAVYPPTARAPDEAEREALRLLTRCAAIVIERQREAAERARTERLLADSEQRLRTVFSAIDEGYALCEIVVDADGRPEDYRFLEVNPQFEAMTGLRDVAGARAYHSVPNLEPHWLETYSRVGLGRETLRFEARSDAMGRWFEVFGTPVEPHGRFVLVFRDISDRRRDEAELQASERRFRTMADGVAAMIWVTDATGGNEFVNRAYSEFFGVDADELRENGWRGLLHPEDIEAYADAYVQALQAQTTFRARVRGRHASGEWRWLDSTGVPRRDDVGRFVGHVGISYDVTELVTTQLALREADQRKDRFIATLSHELRNPLAPIRNAAELLAAPQITPERRVWAGEIVKRQVAHVAALLDDLLDLSRINAGKLSLKRSRTTLGAVVDAAVEAARPLIDAGRHRLQLQVSDRAAPLLVDVVRIVQVLTNLLTNAAKYTDPQGLVALDAGIEHGELLVSVRDDGIGMDRDALGSVFGMFAQVQGERDRAQGGLGIGLALVKGLVELHGGSIAVASAGRGQGSEFLVRIPLPPLPPAPAAEPLAASAPAALRVLVVDDHVDAAETLAMLLRLGGHEVCVAHDADAALAAGEGFAPQVALLDIGLPGVDGHELARRLRARPWGCGVRLVALTGWGQPGDRRRAAEAGFDEHLVKPVDPDRLEAALRG